MSKKFFITLAACMLMIFTLIGCGSNDKKSAGVEKCEIGVIAHLNASEENYNEIMQKLEKSYRPSKATLSDNYKYFKNLEGMQLALESGQIDMLSTYQCVANYMLSKNSDLEILTSERNLSDSFCLAVREGDTILCNDLNKAIKRMTEDGTLADLTKKYIADFKTEEELSPVEIAKIPDAPTIKVALTGDLPPIDMVLANDSPAGFNIAVLAEISKRLGKNIELVDIDSDARAAVLASKNVDATFWVCVPKDHTIVPDNIDRPEGVILTTPYYSDKIVHVALKEKK